MAYLQYQIIIKMTSDFRTLTTVLDQSWVYSGYLVMGNCDDLLYRLHFHVFRPSHFIQSGIIIAFINLSPAKF